MCILGGPANRADREQVTSGNLGLSRIPGSRARVQTLSESLIRCDQTVASGGLLARMQWATVLARRRAPSAECYSLGPGIVTPADWPSRNVPLGICLPHLERHAGLARLRGAYLPLDSSLGTAAAVVSPNHEHGCWPVAALRRRSRSTQESLLHKALSRSVRLARPLGVMSSETRGCQRSAKHRTLET